MRRTIAIACAAFLAGAAAVTVPHKMGWGQIALVALAVGGAALAATLAARLAAEERSRREVEAARRRLVAAASHDLRTPLASLRLLVESIDDGVVTGETRDRYLAEVRTHVAALSALVDDLFELSRIEAGDISWTMSQVELRALVGDTVAAMRAPAAARGVALTAELPDHEVLARANPEKLQRVLFNLLQNAIRHTPADGSVTVRARGDSEAVEVEVADQGEGVSHRDGDRVFEAFYRGEVPDDDGAGLGLAISRAIVEAHGGRIWLEPGAPGTRVRFTLAAAGPQQPS
jgi:signal transduction histidine kinase